MPDLPTLTAEQVEAAIEPVSNVSDLGRGGQKLVFRGDIAGTPYALKFAIAPDELDATASDDEDSEEGTDLDVIVRASREVETMRDCASPHMVKLGPIDLTVCTIDDQRLLYFTEEFIDGRDLRTILGTDGPLPADDVITLGIQLADAIKGLWDLQKVHRDIKPANIMRRQDSGSFVLLDAGFAFDVVGESLSGGMLVGTPIYFSPEQFDYSSRRTGMDFRSDIFALGVTMYEVLTGRHPFWRRGHSSQTAFNNILTKTPDPPSSIVDGVSVGLNEVILRMLGKSPHLRYRKCAQLVKALEASRGSK